MCKVADMYVFTIVARRRRRRRRSSVFIAADSDKCVVWKSQMCKFAICVQFCGFSVFMMQSNLCSRMWMQRREEVISQMCVLHLKSASKVLVLPFCKEHKKLHIFGVPLSLSFSLACAHALTLAL
jgi:hypothetical protein